MNNLSAFKKLCGNGLKAKEAVACVSSIGSEARKMLHTLRADRKTIEAVKHLSRPIYKDISDDVLRRIMK